MKIIKAGPEHIEDILQLNSLLHLDIPNFHWDTKEYISAAIQNYYIMEEDKKILGAINIRLNKPEKYIAIETLTVSPDAQRKGVGRQLIEFTKEYAKSQNIHKLNVESFCEYDADDFYKKCGFTEDEDFGFFNCHPYYIYSMNI
jgi:N-acetylglutamate synthase-like GNAT family acetyltransferase